MSLRASAVVTVAVLAWGSFAEAGRIETGESTRGGRETVRPTPTPGSQVEVSFNPTVLLTVEPDESIEALLERTAETINSVVAGEYTATVDLETGDYALEIFRSDGSEIDQMGIRENDPGIRGTQVRVDLDGLTARIRIPEETPTSGLVVITLNDREIPIITNGILSPTALRIRALARILGAGFLAHLTGHDLVVTRDLVTGDSLWMVAFQSRDPGIVSSDVSVQPKAQ